ncbi:MAG: Ig domain-containing protein [Pirellulaceae bacterium]|nr:Ig domain-containing protein [Pirellulaceae bacterium]
MRQHRGRGGGGDEIGDSTTSMMDMLGNSLGAVVFLLLLMMIIMVLIPRALATLRILKILPTQKQTVDLPPAILGEPYEFTFATEGGEEFVTFELVPGEGELPPGLDWLTETHGDSGLTETSPEETDHRHFRTRVGLAGTPSGGAGTHEFTLLARSALPDDPIRRREMTTNTANAPMLESPPKRFRLAYVHPVVQRIDEIQDLALTTTQLPVTRLDSEGVASARLATSGGLGPIAWQVRSVTGLPAPDVAISAEGLLTARSSGPALVQLEVVATSAKAELLAASGKKTTVSQMLTWRILPPAARLEIATPAILPPAVAGAAYEMALAARGGSGNYRWTVEPVDDAKALAWLARDPAEPARLKGVPEATAIRKAPYKLKISVDDGTIGEPPASKEIALRVEAPALVTADPADVAATLKITTGTSPPPATADSQYQLTLAAQGGRAPYHWAVEKLEFREVGGAAFQVRPTASVSIAEDGLLKISPKVAGEANISVRVWDSNQAGEPGTRTDQKTLHLVIRPGPGSVTQPLRIVSPPTLPPAIEGVDYQVALSAAGGLPPFLWSVEGQVPPSLKMLDTTNGLFGGQPTAADVRTHSFTLVLTDQQGPAKAARLKVSLVVRGGERPLKIVSSKLPPAALHSPYEAPLIASGGAPPIRWSLVSGTLPAGLALDGQTGLIAGEASVAPERPVALRVQATDSAGATDMADASITVLQVTSPRKLAITTPKTLPLAIVGSRYVVQLAVEGGVPPYQWTRGTPWPNIGGGGITLRDTGQLETGILPTAGSHLLRATVADALGNTVSQEFSWKIEEKGKPLPPVKPLEIVTVESLPPAAVDEPYSLAPASEGGLQPITWRVEGELPAGLTFDGRQITGQPTTVAKEGLAFRLVAQDAQFPPVVATRDVTLRVIGSAIKPWWEYFGFAGILAGFLGGLVVIAGIAGTQHQRLISQGLIVVQGPDGAYRDGPQHLIQADDRLNKSAMGMFIVWVLVSLGGAIAFGIYLFA